MKTEIHSVESHQVELLNTDPGVKLWEPLRLAQNKNKNKTKQTNKNPLTHAKSYQYQSIMSVTKKQYYLGKEHKKNFIYKL